MKQLIISLTLLQGLLVSGCSGPASSQPQRYQLEGYVTLDGEPVKAGPLTLEPDRSSGNTGPGSGLEVKDGYFHLAKKTGHVGGKYLATLIPGGRSRTDPPVTGREAVLPKPLTVSLPKADGSLDFSFTRPE